MNPVDNFVSRHPDGATESTTFVTLVVLGPWCHARYFYHCETPDRSKSVGLSLVEPLISTVKTSLEKALFVCPPSSRPIALVASAIIEGNLVNSMLVPETSRSSYCSASGRALSGVMRVEMEEDAWRRRMICIESARHHS